MVVGLVVSTIGYVSFLQELQELQKLQASYITACLNTSLSDDVMANFAELSLKVQQHQMVDVLPFVLKTSAKLSTSTG